MRGGENMKKTIIILMLLSIFAAQCLALDYNWFDPRRPISYSAKPVDKMTLSISTLKNMNSTSSEFFKDNYLFFYMPVGIADLRLEGDFMSGGTNIIEIGTLVNLGLLGLHAGFQNWSYSGGGSDQVLIVETLFDNLLFTWGVGVSTILSSTSSTKTAIIAKIGKSIGLGVVDLDVKAIDTIYGSSSEYEVNLRIKTAALPVFLGIGITEATGGSSNTIVDIGATFGL
jgi:hypothetical protein